MIKRMCLFLMVAFVCMFVSCGRVFAIDEVDNDTNTSDNSEQVDTDTSNNSEQVDTNTNDDSSSDKVEDKDTADDNSVITDNAQDNTDRNNGDDVYVPDPKTKNIHKTENKITGNSTYLFGVSFCCGIIGILMLFISNKTVLK